MLAESRGVNCLRSGKGGVIAVVGRLRVSKEALRLSKLGLLGLDMRLSTGRILGRNWFR